MKEYLIEKYEGYVKELEIRIDNDKPNYVELAILTARIYAYREILTDLKML